LYTGITTDIDRRILEHENSDKGAKYTRGKGPFELVYKAQFLNKSEASKEEFRIKKLTRQEKLDISASSEV
jgi:putative endonuclease